MSSTIVFGDDEYNHDEIINIINTFELQIPKEDYSLGCIKINNVYVDYIMLMEIIENYNVQKL